MKTALSSSEQSSLKGSITFCATPILCTTHLPVCLFCASLSQMFLLSLNTGSVKEL